MKPQSPVQYSKRLRGHWSSKRRTRNKFSSANSALVEVILAPHGVGPTLSVLNLHGTIDCVERNIYADVSLPPTVTLVDNKTVS